MKSTMEVSRTEKRNSSRTMKKELFENVTNGAWEEVVKTYENDHRAYKAKITKSGHTELHLAISEVQYEIVEKLVELIKRNPAEVKEVLRIKIERGYTPLHIAARTGKVRICACITAVDPSLLHVHDDKGKTPIYSAVQYGRKEAFLYLSSVLLDDHPHLRRSCCIKKSDGLTILHIAIIRENFGK